MTQALFEVKIIRQLCYCVYQENTLLEMLLFMKLKELKLIKSCWFILHNFTQSKAGKNIESDNQFILQVLEFLTMLTSMAHCPNVYD